MPHLPQSLYASLSKESYSFWDNKHLEKRKLMNTRSFEEMKLQTYALSFWFLIVKIYVYFVQSSKDLNTHWIFWEKKTRCLDCIYVYETIKNKLVSQPNNKSSYFLELPVAR